MRGRLRVLAVCGLTLLAAPLPAAAEWHFSPFIGVTFRGNTTFTDVENATSKTHRSFGGTVTLLGGGILGAEGLFEMTPRFFQDTGEIVESSRVTALMGNVALTAPRRWTEYSLRPFVSGGFGVLRVSKVDVADPQPLPPVHANLAAFNIGGGAVGFFSKNTGVRFDLRYFSTIHSSGADLGPVAIGEPHLRYMTASVGFVIRR